MEDCDYDAAYDDCDHTCTLYDYIESGTCTHNEFTELLPIPQLEKFKGKNVKTCCTGHTYLLYDQCSERPSTYKKNACGAPNAPPESITEVECPAGCKLRNGEGGNGALNEDQFCIDSNGTMFTKDKNERDCTKV